MRRSARIDTNQKEIVKTLRAIGATVLHTHALKNCFDILVGYRGTNFALEIKRNEKAKLTEGEAEFRNSWRGQYAVVSTIDEALLIIGAKAHPKNYKLGHKR